MSASAQSVETASLVNPGPTLVGSVAIPRLLTADDAARYREIFDQQEEGRWQQADALIAELENPVLLGYVQAQRYLHPTAYRSRYKELRDWMASYADLPQAKQIYDLALRRRPPNNLMPKAPQVSFLYGTGHDGGVIRRGSMPPSKALSVADQRQSRALQRRIRHLLRNGATLAAKRILQSADAKRLFTRLQFDQARALLGTAYFGHGRDQWALEWAGAAADRSGDLLPEAHWTAGLASWRLGNLEQAARHFEAVAASDRTSPWIVSAGAFWAARANLRAGQPQKVNPLLMQAAAHSRTFYGLLARRLLGLPSAFNWTPPELDQAALEDFLRAPAGQRSLALLQIGQIEEAEDELRSLYAKADPAQAQAMLALAVRAGLPSLAMRLGQALYRNGGGPDSAFFPLPAWSPPKGFSVDRALVLAIIRQESAFNPDAKSPAGARGLMQLMPATASFVAKDRSLRGSNRGELLDPGTNLDLGQQYLQMLLNEPSVKGDLFRLAAAWNGGPGNLNKWQRNLKHGDDPLLFIESIPAPETRNFLERVLTNLWVYRHRLGQPTPSLDALAAGNWPHYDAQDRPLATVAQNVPDRR